MAKAAVPGCRPCGYATLSLVANSRSSPSHQRSAFDLISGRVPPKRRRPGIGARFCLVSGMRLDTCTLGAESLLTAGSRERGILVGFDAFHLARISRITSSSAFLDALTPAGWFSFQCAYCCARSWRAFFASMAPLLSAVPNLVGALAMSSLLGLTVGAGGEILPIMFTLTTWQRRGTA